MTTTLQLELTDDLISHLREDSGDGTFYTSPEDLLRDMIRQRIEKKLIEKMGRGILQGYDDVIAGRVVEFNGDLRATMAKANKRETEGWQ